MEQPSLRAQGPQAGAAASGVAARPVTNPYSLLTAYVPPAVLAELRHGRRASGNEARTGADEEAPSGGGYLNGPALRAWRALPPTSALRALCTMLTLWFGAVLARPRCAATPSWGEHAWDHPITQWADDDWVHSVLVDAACALHAERATRPLLLRLSRIRGLAVEWLRPEAPRAHYGDTNPAKFFLHMTGWVHILLLSRWQLCHGACRVAAARRRLIGMPRSLADSLGDTQRRPPAELAVDWLSMQLRLICGRHDAAACVYVLTGAHVSYIGSSAQRPRHPAAGLDMPVPRYAQHIRAVRRGDASVSVHKTRLFMREADGDVAIFACAVGTVVGMRALERRLILATRPVANTSLATRRSWRQYAGPNDGTVAATRRRPPPRFRAALRLTRAPTSYEELAKTLPADILAWREWEARRARAAASAKLREMTFGNAYDAMRTARLRSSEGPIDMFAGDPLDLVTSFVATRGSDVDWIDMVRRHGRPLFYRIGFALLHMRRPGRRLAGVKRWRHGAGVLGELPWRLPVLRLPPETPAMARAAMLRYVCTQTSGGCRWRRAWLSERLRPVHDSRVTFMSAAMNMQKVARTACAQDLLAADPHRAAAAARGEDLIRIKRYWRLPVLRQPTELWQAGAIAIQTWRDAVGACRLTRALVPTRAAMPLLLAPRRAPTPQYLAYAKHLQLPNASQVLIAEDKDRAAAWLADRWAYQWRCARCLLGDGSWVQTTWTHADAAAHIRDVFEGLPKTAGWPRTSPERWAEGIPRLYCTQKAKCWESGRHTCVRPGHVCLRRIASWMHFPGRGTLRRIGRAWRLALVHLGHGIATSSMRLAPQDLRIRSGRLCRDPRWRHRCRRCDGAKAPCCTQVHDASAMYERVPADQVAQAARVVADVLRQRGYRGVAVRHGTRFSGRPVRQGGMAQCGATFVSVDTMVAVLEASLRVNVAVFGDMVLRQSGGLPIGGPLSDLGAGLLLGLQEATWRQMRPWRQEFGFAFLESRADVDDAVAQARYVDDVVSSTAVLCRPCLTEFVLAQHPAIPFSLEADAADGAVRWLDMSVHGAGLPLHIAAGKPEAAWVRGDTTLPTTYRLAPFLGHVTYEEERIRGHIRSRLARWSSMQLGHGEFVAALIYEIAAMLRADYPVHLTLRAWVRHSCDHRQAELVRLTCRHAATCLV